MSERKKWFLQIGLCLSLWLTIIALLILSSASFLVTCLIGSGLMIFIIFFGFSAFKHYYIFPYHAAGSHIRSLIAGNLDLSSTQTSIKEAQDLFATINDLSSDLKAKSKMIDKLERMRIDFVANVSHELKTPLTSIKGYTETLKSGAINDPLVSAKFLDRIEENANRLIAIIGDLLVLSHIESFPQDIKWESFEASVLTNKLDGTFMPNLAKKKQTLKLSFADSKIEGDLKKLEHVFTNLVDNANRYCPMGATIEIKQTKDDFHWIYEVSDNGPGIPAQNQPRIFERFYRVDSDRNRDTGGTGLGLSIVKHMVLLHDGSIKLESELGGGTRFFIRLPRRGL
jgi:signal transduction histidine kinase